MVLDFGLKKEYFNTHIFCTFFKLLNMCYIKIVKSEFTSGSNRIRFLSSNDFKKNFTCSNHFSRLLWEILVDKHIICYISFAIYVLILVLKRRSQIFQHI